VRVVIRTLPLVFALAALLFSTAALAGKPKKDLVDSGYKCERVSVNFIECTKAGSPTYWCDDAGNCEQKARKALPKDIIAPQGGVLDPGTNTGTKGPGGAGVTVKPPKATQ